MFFVTYHGGGDFNNIYAYDQNGSLLSSAVLDVNQAKDVGELRGISFYQGYLYVANGSKQVNNILCCSGSGINYTVIGAFVTGQAVNSISHPFAMAFDDQNHRFVSNQDTNLVTQLNLNSPPTTATAVKGAAASYLQQFDKKDTFLVHSWS